MSTFGKLDCDVIGKTRRSSQSIFVEAGCPVHRSGEGGGENKKKLARLSWTIRETNPRHAKLPPGRKVNQESFVEFSFMWWL